MFSRYGIEVPYIHEVLTQGDFVRGAGDFNWQGHVFDSFPIPFDALSDINDVCVVGCVNSLDNDFAEFGADCHLRG